MTTPLTLSAWTAALAARGLTVLPCSYVVPVDLWLRAENDVLHLRARGTRVTLRRYAPTSLTGLILRSECDCAEHRAAGARTRTALAPGVLPLAEAVFDGAAERGWVGYEAGLLGIGDAAALLDLLLPQVPHLHRTQVA